MLLFCIQAGEQTLECLTYIYVPMLHPRLAHLLQRSILLQQLYESEVPEAVREYVDSKATPVARPKRPVRAAKAANEQAAAMQQEE